MSVSSSGAITTTGNVAGTASYASNAELLDGLDSTVFTLTSSFAAQTASFTAFSSSVNSFTSSLNSFSASILTFTASQNILNGTYATTGSNTFTGIQTVNSNLIVTGSITAQTLVVQTITSSVDFVTGSTRFGSILTNTHVFSGSVTMNPNGLFVSSSGQVGIGTSSPTDNLHIAASEVGNVGISVQNTNASYSSQLRFLNSAGTEKAAVTYVQSTTSLNLNVNQIDALTIGSTGQVNINSSIASNTILNITNGTAGGSGILIQAGNSYANYAIKVLNAAGDEKLRLDGNGNLLVGYTTDQGYKFGVNGTCIFGSTILVSGSATFSSDIQGGGDLYFNKATRTTIYPTTTNQNLHMKSNGSGVLQFNNDNTGNLTMCVGGGNVGIGVTPSYLLHIPQGNNLFLSNLFIAGTASNPILSSGATGGSMYLQGGGAGEGNIYLQGAGSGGNGYIEFRTNGSLRMTIASNGNIGAPSGTNIYNASDLRLKQNVTTITNGLDKIIALNPVKFNWIDGFDSSEDGKDMLGFIAQEVESIIPEAVEGFSNGSAIVAGETTIENPLRVNEKFIIPVLVKAIQELKAENDTLKEILQRNNIQ
jgi:hypothetical protein